ncbi:polysaccharide deacetylase family protein [Bradyrhizobium sp. 521_C7_N1_3]|uniref:polysaccharide deacetylase family protein n=1 Tax=Bradyrhizobium sp. 521_C7_N1_3 TaxID=3240368 RepID=UPI003F892CAF
MAERRQDRRQSHFRLRCRNLVARARPDQSRSSRHALAGHLRRQGWRTQILELLTDEGVPATFFVPGWVVDNRTHIVEKIVKADHEIGHHGYLHKPIDPNHLEMETRGA